MALTPVASQQPGGERSAGRPSPQQAGPSIPQSLLSTVSPVFIVLRAGAARAPLFTL
jgi:hypothetical protein